MSNTATFPGDVVVGGALRVGGIISPARARTEILSQYELQPFLVPWTAWRVWDAYATNLPAAAANDDLGLVGGTWGTDPPCIQAGDLKSAGATSRYARATIALPWEYEDGQSVTLRFHAGMVTAVADTSCTLDVVAYESDEELGLSADICATAAQSMNSLTFADLDFVITPSGLVAGSLLDVRIVVACTDGAGGSAVIPTIGAVKLLCDVR
jgi:hypothetical protein